MKIENTYSSKILKIWISLFKKFVKENCYEFYCCIEKTNRYYGVLAASLIVVLTNIGEK